MITPVVADAFIKKFYSPTYVRNTTAERESKLLERGLLKEQTGLSGKDYTFFSLVDENPSGSADFGSAQDAARLRPDLWGGQYAVPFYEDFELAQVTSKALKQTRNDKGAFASLMKESVNSALRIAGLRKSVALWTTGFGELDNITVTASVPYFTVQHPSALNRFYRWQELVTSASISGHVLKVGSAFVDKIDPTNNRIYVMDASGTAINWDAAIASPATNDWVFTEGDRENSATPTRRRPIGIPGWIPSTAPTNDDLGYGVDRSKSSRYYGTYINTGGDLVDRLMVAVQTAQTFGNAVDPIAVVSANNFTEISKILMASNRYNTTEMKGRGGIGFKTLMIYADGTETPVVSDKYLLDTDSFVFPAKDFEVNSQDPWPHIAMEDGLRAMRMADLAGIESRIYSLSNFACKNTAAFVRVATPT
jgi:hypothetical protein